MIFFSNSYIFEGMSRETLFECEKVTIFTTLIKEVEAWGESKFDP